MGFVDGYFDGKRWADMSVGQRRAAFVKENGGNYILDETDSWCIFATGAMMEKEILGAYIPAFTEVNPNDQFSAQRVKQTLYRKLLYLQTMLGRCIREFETLKKELEARSDDAMLHCAASPEQDEIDKLHELKAEVKQWQEKVDAVELEIDPPPPPVSPERLARDEATRIQAQKVRNEIKAIEV